jgi:Ca2+-binding RTX toxin-like protein
MGMRRTVLLLASIALAVLLVSAVALAVTVRGTARGEKLVGTRYADTISAKGGDDVARGLGGKDRIRGGRGRDVLRGGGDDFLYSQDIFSQSGAFRDVVDCGPGNDKASVDFRDRVVDCEKMATAIP